MRWRGFYIGPAQRVAALLLLVLFGECLWTIAHQSLNADDYRFARCGREMWERPSPLQGYFTTCGNLNGDGTLAYRVAGFPITVQRLWLLGTDSFRKPADRLYAGALSSAPLGRPGTSSRTSSGSSACHSCSLPCGWAAACGGSRDGSMGMRAAPSPWRSSSSAPRCSLMRQCPTTKSWLLWGLYGLIYTAIGVAHALQGPAASGSPASSCSPLPSASPRPRTCSLLPSVSSSVHPVLLPCRTPPLPRCPDHDFRRRLGAVLIDFAGFSFRPSAFSYVLTGGSMRFWASLDPFRHFFNRPANLGILVATFVSLVLYLTTRRSRYFGNTVPLLMTLLLFPLYTSQIFSAPWLWALPFLFTFIGGVFADALETRQRRIFLLLTAAVILAQAILCWRAWPSRPRVITLSGRGSPP